VLSVCVVIVTIERTDQRNVFATDQLQTPGFPHGDGDCLPPGCDVGPGLPVGEYILNPLSANVSVNGQTMLEWYIDDHLFGPLAGGHPNVSGFYL
jgi:hypothetical protein